MKADETGAQTKEVKILDVTPENYIVPKGEETFYHCRIEVRKFNAETGERLSVPRIQKFGKKFFETFGLHNLKKQGYTVDILHNPNDWLEKNKEQLEQMARAKAEAAAKAAEEERERQRAELKASIIEELKQEGLIVTKETQTTKAAKK